MRGRMRHFDTRQFDRRSYREQDGLTGICPETNIIGRRQDPSNGYVPCLPLTLDNCAMSTAIGGAFPPDDCTCQPIVLEALVGVHLDDSQCSTINNARIK